jgi:asparagine synthase (glutamine-hydrolysing)
MRFPGHGRFDETEHARMIARHFGTEHLELEAGDSTIDLLPLLARQFDEPMVDSSMIPTFLICQLTRRHCTVALGGDGGDELFGGYVHYNRLLRMRHTLGRLPRALRSPVAATATALLPLGFKGRNWLQGLGIDLERGLPLIASYFDARSRRALLRGQWPLVGEQIRARSIPQTPDLLQRATRTDFENYLAEDILVKVDRASMLNSLEVRAPLLDYRVIEFAFGKVPSNLKATTAERKILLKNLADRILPPQFDRHRKQGFSFPLASWLRQASWWRFFREVLLGADGDLFDRQAVARVLHGQERGRANSERLFALVMLELWRREYRA